MQGTLIKTAYTGGQTDTCFEGTEQRTINNSCEYV